MSAPKKESTLKARLLERVHEALPRFVVLQLVDSSNGMPDWLIAGNGVISMLEFKHATPAFYSSGIQVLTARRLAANGQCRYVVFWERDGEKRTHVVHPRDVEFGRNGTVRAELTAEGFDLDFVIDYIRKVHTL